MVIRHSVVGNGNYFVMQKLFPGDVFLIDSKTWTGEAIKWATEGKHSHAALYVGAGRFFESTPDNGTHLACFTPFKCEVGSSQGAVRWLLQRPTSWRKVGVFRHPEIRNLVGDREGRAQVKTKICSAMLWERGFDYPSLFALGAASPKLDEMPVLKYWLLELADMFSREPKAVPGLLCSAAVAEVLERAGFSAITEEMDSTQISPNTLSDPRVSCLTLIADCLADEDPSAPNHDPCLDELKFWMSGQHDREFNYFLRGERREIKLLEQTIAQIAELNQLVDVALNR